MNMMQAFAQFIQNPGAFFQQRGLQMPPQSALQSPHGMIQYFMNSGSITQQQYNQAAEKAKQLQNDPQFMNMMQGMFHR